MRVARFPRAEQPPQPSEAMSPRAVVSLRGDDTDDDDDVTEWERQVAAFSLWLTAVLIALGAAGVLFWVSGAFS